MPYEGNKTIDTKKYRMVSTNCKTVFIYCVSYSGKELFIRNKI